MPEINTTRPPSAVMSSLRREREEELRSAIRHAEWCGQTVLNHERRMALVHARRALQALDRLTPAHFPAELTLPQFTCELQLPEIPDFARTPHVSCMDPERTTGLPAGELHERAQFVTIAPQRQPVARENDRPATERAL